MQFFMSDKKSICGAWFNQILQLESICYGSPNGGSWNTYDPYGFKSNLSLHTEGFIFWENVPALV